MPRIGWLLTTLFITLYVTLPVRGQEPPPDKFPIFTTPGGVRFGVWPDKPKAPAPTLFVFANTLEGTLERPIYRVAGEHLRAQGFICVAIDLPCHGQERRADEPDGLAGWRARCDKGEDVMAELAKRAKEVLDHLIAEKLTDPTQIAAAGTSRGGFSALHVAAADPRIRCVAAFAPVTELTVLREFHGAEQNELVRRLSIENQADKLAGRPVWLIIGDRDARVGTDEAIRFCRKVTSVSLTQQKPALVDFHILSEPGGHRTPAVGSKLAAEWILKHLAEAQ